MTYPEFHPIDVDASALPSTDQYFLRLVREALSQAYRRTPWNQAVVVRVRKRDMVQTDRAIQRLTTQADRMRIYLTIGPVADDKRLMIGHGRVFTGTPPWGGEPQPLTAEEFTREYIGKFPPPERPAGK